MRIKNRNTLKEMIIRSKKIIVFLSENVFYNMFSMIWFYFKSDNFVVYKLNVTFEEIRNLF